MASDDLTVGELFPADDVIAQWVFLVTSLSEDINAAMRPMRQAQASGDLRDLLASYRHFITRLYEARRLVEAVDKFPEIQAFAGELLEENPTGFDLRAVYARPADGHSSVVETLYGEIRHRTVHYMRV